MVECMNDIDACVERIKDYNEQSLKVANLRASLEEAENVLNGMGDPEELASKYQSFVSTKTALEETYQSLNVYLFQ